MNSTHTHKPINGVKTNQLCRLDYNRTEQTTIDSNYLIYAYSIDKTVIKIVRHKYPCAFQWQNRYILMICEWTERCVHSMYLSFESTSSGASTGRQQSTMGWRIENGSYYFHETHTTRSFINHKWISAHQRLVHKFWILAVFFTIVTYVITFIIKSCYPFA